MNEEKRRSSLLLSRSVEPLTLAYDDDDDGVK
jgi:hypothetical protein